MLVKRKGLPKISTYLSTIGKRKMSMNNTIITHNLTLIMFPSSNELIY